MFLPKITLCVSSEPPLLSSIESSSEMANCQIHYSTKGHVAHFLRGGDGTCCLYMDLWSEPFLLRKNTLVFMLGLTSPCFGLACLSLSWSSSCFMFSICFNQLCYLLYTFFPLASVSVLAHVFGLDEPWSILMH